MLFLSVKLMMVSDRVYQTVRRYAQTTEGVSVFREATDIPDT
jgi:hypothetical protein